MDTATISPQPSKAGHARCAWLFAATLTVAASVDAGGCGGGTGSTTQPTNVAQRQDQALRDPMNYHQPVGPDSSGDITHLDTNGLKRDLTNVFNP